MLKRTVSQLCCTDLVRQVFFKLPVLVRPVLPVSIVTPCRHPASSTLNTFQGCLFLHRQPSTMLKTSLKCIQPSQGGIQRDGSYYIAIGITDCNGLGLCVEMSASRVLGWCAYWCGRTSRCNVPAGTYGFRHPHM